MHPKDKPHIVGYSPKLSGVSLCGLIESLPVLYLFIKQLFILGVWIKLLSNISVFHVSFSLYYSLVVKMDNVNIKPSKLFKINLVCF